MILVTSTCGSLSCSPRFLNMSVKFWGAWAMGTSFQSEGELQPLLQRVQGQTGQTADHRTVEANVLQVAPHGELDAADQHVDVPGFHLVGDEVADTALLALHEVGKNTDHAVVDLGAYGRVVRELAADLDQHVL